MEAIQKNPGNFRTVIVDNCSNNLEFWKFPPKFDYEIVREVKLGNSYARYKAINLTRANELLIFVDDDNEIAENYVQIALDLVNQNPDWGCFGGRQLAPSDLHVPRRFEALLPYIGIRSLGDSELEGPASKNWQPIEPIGAGMCLSPKAVRVIRNKVESNKGTYFSLGRKGKELISGEDSYLARCLADSELKFGYSPKLTMIHNVNSSRLSIKYFAKLMFGYGITDVLLDKALGARPSHPYADRLHKALGALFWHTVAARFGFLLGLRHLGQWHALQKRVYNI